MSSGCDFLSKWRAWNRYWRLWWIWTLLFLFWGWFSFCKWSRTCWRFGSDWEDSPAILLIMTFRLLFCFQNNLFYGNWPLISSFLFLRGQSGWDWAIWGRWKGSAPDWWLWTCWRRETRCGSAEVCCSTSKCSAGTLCWIRSGYRFSQESPLPPSLAPLVRPHPNPRHLWAWDEETNLL